MAKVYCVKELFDGIDARIKKDYAIYVSKGTIQRIGPQAELTALVEKKDIVRFGRHIMLPAFINAHDHGRAISPAAFGAADGPLELWIPQLGKVAVPIAAAALYSGLQLAAAGVGTVVHCHNYADLSNAEQELADTIEGYNQAGIRVALCPPYIDQNSLIYHGREAFAQSLPPSLQAAFASMVCDRFYSLEDYFSLVQRLRKRFAAQIEAGMVSIQLHPVGAQWCSDEALLAMKDFALAYGLHIHMHLLETKYQMLYAQKRFAKTMVEHLDAIRFLGPWLTCAHAVWLSETDRKLLLDSKTSCVFNPSSNLRLRSGQPLLHHMLAEGQTCALGLDGCGFDDDQDYLREMRVAYLNATATGVKCSLSPADILQAALKGGAHVTENLLSPGRIAQGCAADFILLDLEQMRFPYCSEAEDTLQTILRRATSRSIAEAYVGGTCIAKDGRPQKADMQMAAEALAAGIRALRESRNSPNPLNGQLIPRIQEFYASWEAEL